MEQEQKPQPQTKVKIEVQTKIIKLINGDDIVCDLPIGKNQLPEANSLLRIVKPLQIRYVPQLTPMGVKDYIALIKWTGYSNDHVVTIPKDKIMTITNANEAMSKSYLGVVDTYGDIPLANEGGKRQAMMMKFSTKENRKLNEIFDDRFYDEDDEPGTIH